MQSHKIVWREVTVGEFNDYIMKGLDAEKAFPYAEWIISVDDVPVDELDAKTRLAILPQVMDFLVEMRDTWMKFSIQRMNDGGINSSESVEDTIESSTET